MRKNSIVNLLHTKKCCTCIP